MKRGFSLIELMVATLIGSFLLTGLFSALYLTTRLQVRVDGTTQEVMRASLVQRLMSRDLSGVFLPRKVEPDIEEGSEGKEGAEKKEEKAQKPSQDKDEDQKVVDSPVKKLFYATSAGGNLKELTFVTSNPLQLFWGPVEARPIPRVARVVYRLEPDTEKKQVFKLTRQEGTNLAYEAYAKGASNAPRVYDLIDGIKEMKIAYIAQVPEKVPEEKEGASTKTPAAPKKKQKKRTFKTFTEWKEQKKEEREKQPMSLAPQYVQVTLVLWDKGAKNEAGTYTFTAPIFADTNLPVKKTTMSNLLTRPSRPPVQSNQRLMQGKK